MMKSENDYLLWDSIANYLIIDPKYPYNMT